MSHPNSPRVNPSSAAATALSHAGDTQAPSANASTNPSTADTGAAQPTTSSGLAALVAPAQQWLQSAQLPASLAQMPTSLQRLATQTGNGLRRLSTPQLVVGGAVLAAAGFLLLRPGKAARRRTSRNPAGTLHELLLFVNDRNEGYRRAASESQNADLRNYYEDLAQQSRQFAARLNGYLRVQDGAEETGTTLKGKFYRAWMEAKAAVTGYSETAVLGSNVYGEEWALKAYEEALEDRTVTGSLRREVQRQYEQSQQTHRKLQQLQAQTQS